MHQLDDDDIAIVINPGNYEEGHWDGQVSINLAVSKDSSVPDNIQAHIFNMASMMSAFLDVALEHPDIYDLVAERRDYLLGIEGDEEKLDVKKDGNVYTLSRWTKTEGSA